MQGSGRVRTGGKGDNTIGMLLRKDDRSIRQWDKPLWPIGIFEDEADGSIRVYSADRIIKFITKE